MNQRVFFIQLTIVSLVVAAGLYVLQGLPQLQAHAALGWISLVFFILFCTGMYYAGYRAAGSKNKNDFTNTFLGFTVGKMFISVVIIYAYLQLAQPADKVFILPFFGIYLVYTIFEVYFMARLGKMETPA